MKKIRNNLTVGLILSVIVGIVAGAYLPERVIEYIVPVKHILGQIIFFMVPLIIIGFVAPSIARLKGEASRLLFVAIMLAYLSSIGAAFFAMFLGYQVIPALHIETVTEGLKVIPGLFFQLDIPPVMPVMTALVFSLMMGIAVIWTWSDLFSRILEDFQRIVLSLVDKILLPLLPFFIAVNFCLLSYEGSIKYHLPVFLKIILIVLVCHFVWLALLYGLAGLYAGKNPWRVLKHYGPAYLTAVGTMSSAATLGVAIQSARKSDILREDTTDFSIPLFANIHLCGSVLTEVFFIMTVSQVLYGTLPALSTMIVFILLVGIFAIGAPGVPGGTVMASLGIIISVIGFDEAGTALMLTIFALQDSFGTACNITGDGALSLILSTYTTRREKRKI